MLQGGSLLNIRGSFTVYYFDKIGNGSVPAPFRVFGKVTSRKFPVGPVVADAFAANPLFAAAKGTVTVAFVLVNIAVFCHPYPPVRYICAWHLTEQPVQSLDEVRRVL